MWPECFRRHGKDLLMLKVKDVLWKLLWSELLLRSVWDKVFSWLSMKNDVKVKEQMFCQ